MLKINRQDKEFYLNNGYNLVNRDQIFKTITEIAVPNHLWKIKNKDKLIVHITGRSGTGKSTLVKTLNNNGINADRYRLLLDDKIDRTITNRQEKILSEIGKSHSNIFIGMTCSI